MPQNVLDKSFSNFRGLWDADDSGLIPSNPETGVFASAILNATTEDGTINFNKGYQAESDIDSTTTHAITADTFIRKVVRLKRRDGQIILVAQYNKGTLGWKNTEMNRYEILTTGLTSSVDIGFEDFNKTDQDRTYIGDGINNLSYWNKAIAYYASDNG
jgi:hypothetical protein